MVDTLLWDIDDTLLNFHKSEEWAIRTSLKELTEKEIDDEALSRYRTINHSYWKKLELGEIEKKDLLWMRFRDFFEAEGIKADPKEFNGMFQSRLGDRVFPNDDGVNLCRKLKGSFKQYAVSNGTKTAQYKKLRLSGLDEIFDGIFISEEVGFEKPKKEFFDYVFSQIGEERRATSLMIGDSLTSDMRGGNNAEITCVWYNPKKTVNETDVHIDYEISNLWDIEKTVNN